MQNILDRNDILIIFMKNTKNNQPSSPLNKFSSFKLTDLRSETTIQSFFIGWRSENPENKR